MINDSTAFRVDWMPFGGRHHSGLGMGGAKYSIEEMTRPKLIVLNKLHEDLDHPHYCDSRRSVPVLRRTSRFALASIVGVTAVLPSLGAKPPLERHRICYLSICYLS